MKVSNLTSGVGFTGIMLNCWKLNGNHRDFWEKCNLKPSRTDRLFNPVHMELFINSFAENLVNGGSMKFLQIMAAMRQKYINDLLDKLSKANVNQVIILGAGFDIRASSAYLRNTKFFEVDCKEVQEIKRAVFMENNIEPNAKYISIDYVEDGLIVHLKEARVDFNMPTLFIYEGNSMYNTKSSINKVFNEINNNFQEFFVVMDYLSEDFINQKTGIPELDLVLDNNSYINASLINGYNNIEGFTNSNNLKLHENLCFGQLAFKYGIHNNPSIPEMNDYSIVTASNIEAVVPENLFKTNDIYIKE